jgi:glycosyltransferase involved in cell wall biosynthesis
MARILLVNKFYYPRGGDCTATLSLENLLREKGHEVAIFSSAHAMNNPSEWSNYFPSEIDFFNTGPANMAAAIARPFFSGEIKKKFIRLLNEFKPDVVHVHNIHSYLSPYIIQLAAQRGLKTVWTLHDYKLICPAYTCLRDGKICELCFHRKWPTVKYRCIKHSLKASLLSFLEAKVWSRKKLEQYTSKFISPSHFLKKKMISASFDSARITVIHNFIPNLPPSGEIKKKDYYCYAGRLSPEKGLDTLLEAAESLPYLLYILGDGNEMERLKKRYASEKIQFLGYQAPAEVIRILRQARMSVIPSIWYENNPLSVIESLCAGTPVIGANIGGIPELIEEGWNGFLFTPGAVEELKQKITKSFHIFDDSYPYQKIADKARDKFSADAFYGQISKIYGFYKNIYSRTD